MTSYVDSCPKTKKGLKELIGVRLILHDPKPFAEFDIVSHPVNGLAVVGPGPYERKWYAQIWTDSEGILLKVK